MTQASLPCILVCVSDIMRSARLIETGMELSRRISAPLRVLSVQPRSAFQRKAGAELEHLFSVSRAAGADMTVRYDDRRVEAVVDYIGANPAHTVVLGAPGPGSNALHPRVRAACPGVQIVQVTDGESQACASAFVG